MDAPDRESTRAAEQIDVPGDEFLRKAPIRGLETISESLWHTLRLGMAPSVSALACDAYKTRRFLEELAERPDDVGAHAEMLLEYVARLDDGLNTENHGRKDPAPELPERVRRQAGENLAHAAGFCYRVLTEGEP